MPFLAPFAGPIIGAVGSAFGGALANRGTKSTSTSTSTPTWSPEMQGLQGDLLSAIQKRMADPAAGTEPIRLGLLEKVNQRYRGLPSRVGTQLAKRGMGQSGQMGAALKGLELARSGEISDVNTSMASTILGREDSTLQLINQILGLNRGTTSTGTQTGSGNMLGGAVGAGTETLTTMLLLDKILKGNTGGGSPVRV